LHETLGCAQVRRRSHADILGADFFEIQQFIIRWLGAGLCAKLDTRIVLMDGGAGRRGREERGGSQRGNLVEFAAIRLCAQGD
jgi:hypothetical protein